MVQEKRNAFRRCLIRREMGSEAQSDFYSFVGKKAVVVAGTSGIGLAAAQLFVQLGGEAVVVSSNRDKVAAAVKLIGRRAEGEVVDGTQEDQVRALFDRIGSFDHLIASSGRGRDKPFLQASGEDLRGPWEKKYWLQALAARYGAPHLRAGGSITLISGTNGTKPSKGTTQAAAINAAVEGLARGLAVELSPIRVNVVSPGAIDTPLWEQFAPDPKERAAKLEALKSKLLTGTVGQSDEVARIIIAAISSPFTTGAKFEVNGGALLV
ncbi:hypothetical protein WJX72_011278 [[Myrmecia] bisecta]|uniref:SDR family oxidoreductase n=1 Tax=[Myrmecia] bisecta TaxID=41462 RepID=A0AAW1P063_9CHLO